MDEEGKKTKRARNGAQYTKKCEGAKTLFSKEKLGDTFDYTKKCEGAKTNYFK